jgi:hypothetical protein
MAHLGGAEPGATASPVGTDVKVVADADNSDRYEISQCVVASQWRDLKFFCCFDLAEFVTRPCCHQIASF